ncbi:MAG: benzoyl-CoA reductase subunit C [Bdellovibrionaceae bacterium]|nr:benzoyl-CoA reductase subunit C [Bdellovibrionales bacterium]MCB9083818.1 benzoyl-CoA reductase subunit C [Pseudobdellovibrionaceae bacterium]
MNVKEIISYCENLYNDLDFTYVKDWKNRTGGKAVGYLPVYVPREVIHAAGMLPVGVMGGGSDLEIIKGDAYFQSYICHIPRSTIELGVSGRLDCMDGMLFPAICDVIRNLSGMWQMLFKDKFVKYMDLPQNFDKAIGGEFYKFEMRTLAADLEKLGGKKVTEEALNHSIQLYNENRRALAALYKMRSEQPHLVWTSEVYLLLRAANIMDVEEHTKLVKQYMEQVVHEKRNKMDNIRVVVSGAFCEQPPLALIKGLEQSGCYIVEDDWVLGVRFIEGDIKPSADPLESLASAYLFHGVETASKYEDKAEKGAFLVDQVKRLNAEGVIFCAPSFCDPALLERPMLTEALTRANIPFTSFNYSENTGQFSVFKEQTGTFADSIKLWGC